MKTPAHGALPEGNAMHGAGTDTVSRKDDSRGRLSHTAYAKDGVSPEWH